MVQFSTKNFPLVTVSETCRNLSPAGAPPSPPPTRHVTQEKNKKTKKQKKNTVLIHIADRS